MKEYSLTPRAELILMTNTAFFRMKVWVPLSGFISLILVIFLFSNAALAETTILMLGDSLTAGHGVEKEQAFPALVEARLKRTKYPNIKVINAGFSGSTTASALSRLRWYLRIKPDILVLALGGNDGLRGLDLKATEKNLASTIELAKKEHMVVVLAGMKIPPNYGDKYTREFESLYPALAKRYNVALIPFLLERVGGEVDLNIADGIHPNPDGHKIVAETVLQHLLPILKNAQ